ncbi:MAG: SGNH/GDSL hydrolase family protein [Armatimonas sp.]
MKVNAGANLLFVGDSITDCGRGYPVGEANPWNWGEIGDGYVRYVAAHLGAAHPERKIRVRNVGTSGNTVRDLAARWDTDVIALKPHWLSVMIGINDVWRQFDSPLAPERAVTLEDYRATLEGLLRRVRPQLSGLVLMTPFVVENNPADPFRARMREYADAVRSLSVIYDAQFVDTQAAFDEVLAHTHGTAVAWDRIHPGPVGHMVLARAFLKAIEAL